jgi:mutator protein MutT
MTSDSTKITAEWPPKKVVCAGAVVLHKGNVLLIRQAEGHSLAGQWSIPWGIVEANEQPEETAVRETIEESGINAEVEGLLGYQNFRWQSMVAFIYLCRHVSGEPTEDGVETDQAGYFSLAELDALSGPIEPWTNWLIRRVLSGKYHLIPLITNNPEHPLSAFF